jgi:hypothetical protein
MRPSFDRPPAEDVLLGAMHDQPGAVKAIFTSATTTPLGALQLELKKLHGDGVVWDDVLVLAWENALVTECIAVFREAFSSPSQDTPSTERLAAGDSVHLVHHINSVLYKGRWGAARASAPQGKVLGGVRLGKSAQQ